MRYEFAMKLEESLDCTLVIITNEGGIVEHIFIENSDFVFNCGRMQFKTDREISVESNAKCVNICTKVGKMTESKKNRITLNTLPNGLRAIVVRDLPTAYMAIVDENGIAYWVPKSIAYDLYESQGDGVQ